MVLMGVAVGCGLVAAFLTSKLGAGNNSPEMVEVVVAKKELPIGTLLDEKDFAEVLTKAPFSRNNVPPDIINNTDELKGKRLSRTLRAGNYFAPSDVNGGGGIPLPTGCYMYAIRLDAVRAAAGFVKPGDKVEVLALQHAPNNANLVRSRLILSDMLCVAVDIHDRRPEGGGPAIATISSVSLAVTPDQAKLLHNCESTGGELRLLLRGPQSNYAQAPKVDKWDDFSDLAGGPADQVKGPDMVQVAFAKVEVPLNTKITGENLGEFFELRSYLAPAPAAAVKDLSDLKGRFVRNPLAADLPVLNSALADTELAPMPPTVVIKEKIVKEVVEGPTKYLPGETKIVERNVPTPVKVDHGFKHTLTIQNGTHIRRHEYRGPSEKGARLVEPNESPETAPEQPKVEDKPEAKPETTKPEAKPESKPAKPEEKPAKPADPQVTLAK